MGLSGILYAHMVVLALLCGGQESLPLKVAPIQPSVTTALHLQSRRDSDCQLGEFTDGYECTKLEVA